MCRCCQTCWEDFYWNCFEERFCYDESIANYNPEEDEDYIAAQKAGNALALAAATQHRTNNNNNNHLTVPEPICQQPVRGGHANFNSLKIHEEDFRRETQTNVPMLGPEILAVFANSQIFQDHQPTKLSRINTKTHLAGIHSNGVSSSPSREMMATSALAAAAAATALTAAAEQERLIRSLEANLNDDVTDANTTDQSKNPTVMWEDVDVTPEKRITFTLTSADTSPSDSIQTLNSKKFYTISEEQSDIDHASQQQHHQLQQNHPEKANSMENEISNSDEVILRPRLMPRYPSNLLMQVGPVAGTKKRTLRTVKSVPHLNMRTISGDVDIFAITGGSEMSISMTPEVPSISFANLPKNYVDTPTIEKYRVSQSLYAIQSANAAARAMQDDFSMPRYFRKSGLVSHSIDGLQPSASTSQLSSMDMSAASTATVKQMTDSARRPEIVKSKRLQMLRSNLAPLLIHSVSFKRNRGDESKQVD